MLLCARQIAVTPHSTLVKCETWKVKSDPKLNIGECLHHLWSRWLWRVQPVTLHTADRSCGPTACLGSLGKHRENLVSMRKQNRVMIWQRWTLVAEEKKFMSSFGRKVVKLFHLGAERKALMVPMSMETLWGHKVDNLYLLEAGRKALVVPMSMATSWGRRVDNLCHQD